METQDKTKTAQIQINQLIDRVNQTASPREEWVNACDLGLV